MPAADKTYYQLPPADALFQLRDWDRPYGVFCWSLWDCGEKCVYNCNK